MDLYLEKNVILIRRNDFSKGCNIYNYVDQTPFRNQRNQKTELVI
uniref:Uncharacterized protein n=1 Tax=Arundo donax TaxID=35708 RepID=A0A0A9GUA3_ARUDO